MGQHYYTAEQIAFLKQHRDLLRVELVAKFNQRFNLNKSVAAISYALFSRGWQNKPIRYSVEQLCFIEQHCHLPRKALTQQFNHHFNTAITVKAMIALCKRKVWLSGRDGRFKPGHVPANKNTKGISKPNSGSFQKGHRPKNWMPTGAERVNGDGYLDVKIAEPNVWRAKHRLLWVAEYGPIPTGLILTFKDGDKRHCALENLELITRQEHVRRNKLQYSKAPDAIKPTIAALVKLQLKTANIKCLALTGTNSDDDE